MDPSDAAAVDRSKSDRLLRVGVGALACAALLAACAKREDPQSNTPPPIPTTVVELRVEVDGGAVTVRARDSDLKTIIETIAERNGRELVVQDPLDERVSVELQSLPLSTALRQLLGERSFVLLRTAEAGRASAARHGTLWIFSQGSKLGRAPAMRIESAEESQAPTLATLRAGLANDDANVRVDAVSDLGQSRDAQAPTMLASTASHDADPSVRAEALYALGAINADAHSPTFKRALTDPNPEVRKAAISALDEIGTESSVQTLATALNDADASLRAAAVDALGEIGGDTAHRLLQRALTDQSSAVREAANEQLEED